MIIMQQFNTINEQALLLAKRNIRSPARPSFVPLADIEGRAENTEGDAFFHFIFLYKCFYSEIE